MEILKDCGKTVIELSGIKSNPTYVQMMEGARLVRVNNVDLILAVGGGYKQIDAGEILEILKVCY